MLNILITGLGASIEYNQAQLDELSKVGKIMYQQDMTHEELLAAAVDMDVIMTDWTKIGEDVFEAAKHLKLVVEHGVGYDNIDVASATRHNVLVCHTPTVYTDQVAEMAVALTFALSKHIHEATMTVKDNGLWDNGLTNPRHVSGKTLGVVGCGRIGSAFIKMMKGFNMNVLVYDPYIPESRITDLGATPKSFDELLAASDIISIHTPKTAETIHMFSTDEFAKMKDGVILVNTARGGIVDEYALADAMKSGKVLAAALDVLEGEPDSVPDCPLRGQERALLTPHMSWKTEYSVNAVITQCIKDVLAYVDGNPVYMCNPEVWEIQKNV